MIKVCPMRVNLIFGGWQARLLHRHHFRDNSVPGTPLAVPPQNRRPVRCLRRPWILWSLGALGHRHFLHRPECTACQSVKNALHCFRNKCHAMREEILLFGKALTKSTRGRSNMQPIPMSTTLVDEASSLACRFVSC